MGQSSGERLHNVHLGGQVTARVWSTDKYPPSLVPLQFVSTVVWPIFHLRFATRWGHCIQDVFSDCRSRAAHGDPTYGGHPCVLAIKVSYTPYSQSIILRSPVCLSSTPRGDPLAPVCVSFFVLSSHCFSMVSPHQDCGAIPIYNSP